MENITEKELAVLNSIPSSEYVCLEKTDKTLIRFPTWTFTCEDSGYKGKTLSGIISSLVKKGLVETQIEDGNDTICLTEKGFEAIQMKKLNNIDELMEYLHGKLKFRLIYPMSKIEEDFNVSTEGLKGTLTQMEWGIKYERSDLKLKK